MLCGGSFHLSAISSRGKPKGAISRLSTSSSPSSDSQAILSSSSDIRAFAVLCEEDLRTKYSYLPISSTLQLGERSDDDDEYMKNGRDGSATGVLSAFID